MSEVPLPRREEEPVDPGNLWRRVGSPLRRRPLRLERTLLGSRALIADSMFLICVTVGTAVLWISRMGFSSDDWNFLRIFRFAPDQSVLGLYKSAFAALPGARMRPIQLLYSAASYKLWGVRPFGYHAVNVIVLAAIGFLLWALLRELGQPRVWALASAVVYLTLPNYTSARFWTAAYEATLSIALYLLSFYADLRSLRASGARVWGWRALGVASLVACVMAYEVALPLFAINIMVTVLLARRVLASGFGRGLVTAALEGTALVAACLFKLATQVRDSSHHAYVPYVVGLVKNALVTHGLGWGLGLPVRVWRAANRYPDPRILGLSIVIALLVAGYLWSIAARAERGWPTGRAALAWFCAGVVVFALGHAIFLVTETGARAGFSMVGKINRVAVAATLGVALCFIGAIGGVVRLLPAARRGAAFASLVGLVAAGGFLIDNTVAKSWTAAYAEEKILLAAIQQRFPRLPGRSALILDGVCSYVGPAVVFKSRWDLAGALAVTYGDPDVRAGVVSRDTTVHPDGLVIRVDSDETLYRFSEGLIVFDPRSGTASSLPDPAAAREYFEGRPKPQCPRQVLF